VKEERPTGLVWCVRRGGCLVDRDTPPQGWEVIRRHAVP